MDKAEDKYLEWAKLIAARFDERRRYEWKINFAVWSAIALVTSTSLKDGIRLYENSKTGYCMAVGITIIYAIVTLLIRDGHHRDGKDSISL